jgi:hypothetical protein
LLSRFISNETAGYSGLPLFEELLGTDASGIIVLVGAEGIIEGKASSAALIVLLLSTDG